MQSRFRFLGSHLIIGLLVVCFLGFDAAGQVPLKKKKDFVPVRQGESSATQQTSSSGEQAQPKKRSSKKRKKRKKRRRRKKDRGQSAVVIVDGSAVYNAPSFDAPVKDYLDRGKKVRVSKKVYSGAGGLGAFFKVRLRRGVFGYIADVDLQIQGKSGVDVTRKDKTQDTIDPTVIQDDINDTDVPEQGGTLYLTRYLGVSYMSYNYSEEIGGNRKTGNIGLIGIRSSGPGKAIGGLPIEYEFSFSTDSPDFYDKFASSADGFLIISHAMGMFPIWESTRSVLYYGAGLNLRYASYEVKLKSAPDAPAIDSQEVGFGATLALGFAMGIGQNWCLRLDGKYLFEEQNYGGFGLAFQHRF